MTERVPPNNGLQATRRERRAPEAGRKASMTTLSVEQQIAQLRPLVGFAPDLQKWLLGGAAAGVIAAVLLWHPWPLMIGAFVGFIGFAERRNGPNMVLAIHAYDCGTATIGEVSIAFDSSDTVTSYRATVREQGHPDWEYAFISQGWQLASGVYPARIWRTNYAKQPVLTVVEEGILIPRYDPKQVDKENQ